MHIDSDNNDGFNPPLGGGNNNQNSCDAENDDENEIEDCATLPGKILLASTWDSDGDNIPDYADGYNLLTDASGLDPHKLDDPNHRGYDLIPVRVDIRGVANLAGAYLQVTYHGNHPINDVGHTAGDLFTLNTGTAAAPKNLRLWAPRKPPGSTEHQTTPPTRDMMQGGPHGPGTFGPLDGSGMPGTGGDPCPPPRTQLEPPSGEMNGGLQYVVSGEDMALDTLVGAERGQVLMYIQAVGASPALAQRLTFTLVGAACDQPADCTDAVRVTAVDRELVTKDRSTGAVVSAGGLIQATSPRPEVQLSVTNAALQANGDLVLQVHWRVEDALSEIIDEPASRVQSLVFLINGEEVDRVDDLPTLGAGAAVLPWQPHRLSAEGNRTITIHPEANPANPARHRSWGGKTILIHAQSTPNAAGNVGWDRATVSVRWRQAEVGESSPHQRDFPSPSGTPVRYIADAVTVGELDGSPAADFDPLVFRLTGVDSGTAQSLTLNQNDTEQELRPFAFSPIKYYPVVQGRDGRPKIVLVTVESLPAGITDITADNLQEVWDNGEVRYRVVDRGGNEIPAATAEVLREQDAIGGGETLMVGGGDGLLTKEKLFAYFAMLYGDEAVRLYGYFEAADPRNDVVIRDLWFSDFDFDWTFNPGNFITIEIDEGLDPIQACEYLALALKQCTGYTIVQQQINLNEPGGLEAFQQAYTHKVELAAEVVATAADMYFSSIAMVSQGADVVMTINDLQNGNYAMAAVSLAPLGIEKFIKNAKRVRAPADGIPENWALRIESRTTSNVLERFTREEMDIMRLALERENRDAAFAVLKERLTIADRVRMAKLRIVIKPATTHAGMRTQMIRAERIARNDPAWQPPQGRVAHHKMPWEEEIRVWLAAHNFDVNDPQYGEWTWQTVHQQSGERSHYYFNLAWKRFRDEEPEKGLAVVGNVKEYTPAQITAFMNDINSRFFGITPP